MGCGCSSEGRSIASVLFMFERFGTSLALIVTICCIMVTTVTMLSLGIGLGYNYCFVDFKARNLHESTYPRDLLIRKRKSIENEKPVIEEFDVNNIKPTMVVPLNSKFDLIQLISRIKEAKKNISLEILSP